MRKNVSWISALLLATAGVSGEGLVGAMEPEHPPDPVVSGRVLDPQGRPAMGATVHLIAHRKFGPRTAKTGRDGAFSFPVQAGGIYRLMAEKDGFGAARRPEPLRIHDSAPGIELRLHQQAILSGRVLGLTGKELTGLTLTLLDGYAGADGKLEIEAGGRYRVSNLPPGECLLKAEAGVRTAAASATLAEGDKKVLDVVFPRLTPVRGRVLGPDGTPAAGAQVVCPGPSYDQGTTYSEQDGRFVSLSPKECRMVWARSPGGAPTSVPVNVAAGPVDGVEIHLEPALTLTGRLLGLRAPDCKLSLYAHGAAPFALDGHADVPGHYAVPGFGAGAWSVVATCGEQSALRPLQIRSGEAAPTLDLDFGPGPLVLSGRVLGEPGARYEVSLDRTFSPAAPLGRAEVTSGESFRFANLQPGTYEIYVLEPGLPAASTYRHPIYIEGEEILGIEDAYESIGQMKVDLQADREVTLDVRDGRQSPSPPGDI